MAPDPAFRLSTYLTLGVAFISLGYAESFLFPEVGLFTIVVVVVLASTYHLETRVRLLALSPANTLGACIGLVGLVWGGYRIVHELRESEFGEIGWLLFLVALMAPVLMAAVAAKLLRSEKQTGDYWFLHAAGLGAIALSGAMAERPLTFALIGAYLACGVWSLSRFYLARSNGSLALPAQAGPAAPTPPGTTQPSRSSGVGPALLCTAATVAAAAILYLLTPRAPFAKFEFGSPQIEIGFSPDQTVDLNRTGNLDTSADVAFEVTATNENGQTKTDLNADTRWQGSLLTHYQHGVWRRDIVVEFPTVAKTARKSGPWSPPDLGPGRYQLLFQVPAKLRSVFLADPVVWAAGEPAPIADWPAQGSPLPWRPLSDGTFLRLPDAKSARQQVRYVQYSRPLDDPDLGPPFTVLAEGDRGLVNNPLPRVKTYSDQLLNKLIAEGRLPPSARDRDSVRLRVPEVHHEAIARAFADHFTKGTAFRYATSLRRQNRDIDPVEEFLFETREGHCERFASALALLLRAQGIPTVLALGFKGCVFNEGKGVYEVRNEHAHAWVEALVSRPTPDHGSDPANPQDKTWHWLSLDPTPGQSDAPGVEAKAEAKESTWWRRAIGWGRKTFNRYIVKYTPDERRQTIRELTRAFTTPETYGGATALAIAGLAIWAVRRRVGSRAAPESRPAQWFDQLLDVLAAHGFVPGPGETPGEFAAATAGTLRRRPAVAGLADVPREWAEAYYESRFGNVPLTDSRRLELQARLNELRQALSKDRRGGQ